MVGEYEEEMKKGNKAIVKDYYGGLREAIEKHSLTYSGWLQHVKKLSDEEVSSLFDDGKRNSELQEEYELWFCSSKAGEAN